MIRTCLISLLLCACLPVDWAAAFDPAADRMAKRRRLQAANEALGPRFDTSVDPVPHRRRGHKIGQRVVYTIAIDNDDPNEGMRDLTIWMERLPEHMRLDFSETQPLVGNIFYDSAVPAHPDTPVLSRVYYISKPEGETRVLTAGTHPDSIQDVFWLITRGKSEQVIAPHNGNENIYSFDWPDTAIGAAVDADQLFVRYSAIVVGNPVKSTRKK